MVTAINPTELVQLIVWLASQRGERLTPIRAVKFLYLADLYYARRHEGQTLTGWPWGFVHYGPYCSEAIAALRDAAQRGLIAVHTYQSRYDDEEREVYSCDLEDEPALSERLPLSVLSPLKAAVKRWADDTAGLLDHVYFETEPMLDALPGERLDFSTAREIEPEEPVKMVALSRTKLRAAQEIVGRLRDRYAQTMAHHARDAGSRDADYQRALDVLDEEPLQQGLTGEAEIIVVRERGGK